MKKPALPPPSRRARPLPDRRRRSCSKDGQIARNLWFKFCRKANFALLSPFSICLAAGDLQTDAFAHFVSQDDKFLKAFAIALQAAADHADDHEAKKALSQLRTDITKIHTRHKSFLKKWVPGAPLDTNVHPATTRYTDFLLKAASRDVEHMADAERKKLPAYVLAATAASLRMCIFLAEEFKDALDPKGGTNRYRNWIEYYAAHSLKASSQKIEDLLDKMHVCLPSEELEFLESLYFRSIFHGVDIITEQLISQPSVVPLISAPRSAEHRLMFFSNFDLSCTLVDSSHVLAEFAIDFTTPKSLMDKSEGRFIKVSTEEMENRWKKIKDQRKQGYQKFVKSIVQDKSVKKFNYEHTVKAIQPLSDFDKEANLSLIDSGLLQGLKFKQIARLGGTLLLNSGCELFFQSLLNNKKMEANAHILSCCWCADVISCSSLARVADVNVYANELIYNEVNQEMIAVGMIRLIESPEDKLKLFRHILENTSTNKKNLTVYVGHTLRDLICLLEADIGIVINCNTNLKMVGDKLRVSFVPLFPGLVKKQKELRHGVSFTSNSKKGVLYTVTSWTEIHAFILGIACYIRSDED